MLEIEELIREYKPMVFRVAMGFVHDPVVADEIVQDCFVSIYDKLSEFRGDAHVSTWIYRICCNRCLNYCRSQRLKVRLEEVTSYLSLLTNGSNSEDRVIEDELNDSIRNAINKLPPLQKQAFVLRYYEELNQKEIALIMHKSEGAVEQLLQRAKAKLRENIKK